MTVAEVEEATDRVIGEELPEEWAEALGDITIHVAADRRDLGVLRTAIKEAGQRQVSIPQDFRAVFLGTPVDPAADLDDDQTEGPTGVIVLNAAMLRDEDDVLLTLLHEFGHALGYSEDEIKALELE